MPLFQRILVAVDSTDHSVRMARSLLKLPSTSRAQVTALHVVPKQTGAVSMRENQEQGAQFLKDAVEQLSVQPDITVSTRLEEGDAKTTVLKVADDIDASLIVMGARGMGRLMSILKNSVSQYVFQLSTRPMLLVKEEAFIGQLRRVMVAIDGSEAAREALSDAIALVRDISGSEILLARVIDRAEASSRKAPIEQLEREDKVLADALALLKRDKVSHRAYFAIGDPGREIAMLSGESGANLLVMGSPDRRPTVAKGLPDLERLLGKSVSDYVRVHAACPVLMTRLQA
ncbi:MAG: universal stress protein [Cyanobacteria bacterium J06642_2]